MKRTAKGREQDGFTIIEVLMFLAIGGALISLMVFAVYRMIDNSRFSDTINSATSFVQTQYEEARSGVRPDGTNICDGTNAGSGRSDCLLLGKAIVFRDLIHDDLASSTPGVTGHISDTIESYFVVSEKYDINASKTSIDNDSLNAGSDGALIDSQPHLTAIGRKEHSLMYNAHYAVDEKNDESFPGAGALYRSQGGTVTKDEVICNSGGNCAVNVVLVLRNPKNAALNTYAINVSLNDTINGANSTENIVIEINKKIKENSYAIFKASTGVGVVARNASVAIPIVNGDSNSRSLGAICLEQGASSASIFSVRELGYYSNVKKNISVTNTVKMLRDKCENM
jgi:type II secretory pathway pseudopilin PulG